MGALGPPAATAESSIPGPLPGESYGWLCLTRAAHDSRELRFSNPRGQGVGPPDDHSLGGCYTLRPARRLSHPACPNNDEGRPTREAGLMQRFRIPNTHSVAASTPSLLPKTPHRPALIVVRQACFGWEAYLTSLAEAWTSSRTE